MRDIGTAINFLHNINIAHRDIKVKKALNGLAVPYLSEILVLLKQSGDSEVTQPTFSVVAPRLWNQLPLDFIVGCGLL